jgi:hypothetical protein
MDYLKDFGLDEFNTIIKNAKATVLAISKSVAALDNLPIPPLWEAIAGLYQRKLKMEK